MTQKFSALRKMAKLSPFRTDERIRDNCRANIIHTEKETETIANTRVLSAYAPERRRRSHVHIIHSVRARALRGGGGFAGVSSAIGKDAGRTREKERPLRGRSFSIPRAKARFLVF
jgi:hypothetical protein